MLKVVIEEPYRFIPPHRGTATSWFFRFLLPTYLKASHGIVDVKCRGLDRLQKSVDEGYGVLLTPNHCRLSDPMTMGSIVRETNIHIYTMASWHLFNQDTKMDRLSAWMMRQLGAFSIFREGVDRAALNCAIDILVSRERPLVVFPEGTVNRTNDRLGPLMEGVTFIARAAAKKSIKAGNRGVVVHPTALRYAFLDDVSKAVLPSLEEFEKRLTFWPRKDLSPAQRANRLLLAILALKEVEHLGHATLGDAHDRRIALIDELLSPIEERVLGKRSNDYVIARVKEIRTAILAKLLDTSISETEKANLRDELADAYLAQQLHFHPETYLSENAPPEHLLETVERLEEDLTDRVRVYGRMKVLLEIGEPIVVSTERERGDGSLTLLQEIGGRLEEMLARSAREVAEWRARKLPSHVLFTPKTASFSEAPALDSVSVS